MSEATTSRSEWLRHSDPLPAQERLRAVVNAMTRARHLQVLLDHGLGGLLAGLGAATVAVLVVRLAAVPYSMWQITTAAIGIAVATALAIGWRRRPDALEVAIHADLMLRLKQRLSTAWEIMTVRKDGELAERLAAEAVKAGLPAHPRRVFPMRVNRWGWLLPLTAVALLLVNVLDLNRPQPIVPRQVDERVTSEGKRLSAFARAMQARAKRDALPRSARQAAGLERLGARMESGALSRGQTLEQLRQMGRTLDEESAQALAEANAEGERQPAARRAGVAGSPGATQEGTEDNALARALQGGNARTSAQDRLDERGRSAVPRGELKQRTRRNEAVDQTAKGALQDPVASARALKDHEELRRAREQVRHARENLDDALAGIDAEGAPTSGAEASEGGENAEDLAADKRRDGKRRAIAARDNSRGDASAATEMRESRAQPQSSQSGPVLKPQAEMRAGEVFASPGRVLPKVTQPSVENVEMKPEFATQVESVISRDQYPAHYKEFVRRYFLSLSQGEQAPQPQPSGERDGRGQ